METFLSIKDDIILENEIVEKKSRFLAFAKYVKTSEEAEEFYRKLKMRYPDAKHVVFAYRLLNTSRASDDGEPGGTAGKPILQILEKMGIYNIIVCVVRYFGGVKLGAGPLLRVYANSATSVLTDLRVYEKAYETKLSLTFKEFEKIIKSKQKIVTKDTVFEDNIFLTAIYPKDLTLGVGKEISKKEIYYSFGVNNECDNKNRR